MNKYRFDRKVLIRVLAGLLILGLAGSVSVFPVSAVTGSQTAKDGEYTWDARVSSANTARWKSYKVSVTLTVRDRIIQEIQVTPDEDFFENCGNDYFFKQAKNDFWAALQGKTASEETIQQWDAVSGATCASNGIKKAALYAIRLADPVASATEAPTTTPAENTGIPTSTPAENTGAPTSTPAEDTGVPTSTPAEDTGTPTPTVPPEDTGTPTPTAPATDIPEKIGSGVIRKISSPSYNKLKITWGKVKNATGYILYRSTSAAGRYREIGRFTGGNLSCTDRNLTTGKNYYYKVRAMGSGSALGGFSAAGKGKPALGAPEVSPGGSKGKAAVKWKKVKGASGYQIWRAGSKSGRYQILGTAGQTSFKDKKAVRGKVYYYKVRAYRMVNKKKVYGGYSAAEKAVSKTGKGR